MSSSTSNSKTFGVAFGISTLATICLFMTGSEWIIRKFVLPNDNFHAHSTIVAQARQESIALGDSRICVGYVSNESIANLGYPAATIHDIAVMFNVYSEQRLPKTVLLQANPFLLKTSVERQREKGGQPFAHLFKSDRKLFVFAPSYRPRLVDYWKRLLLRKSFVKPRPVQKNGGQLWEKEINPEAPDFPDYLGRTLVEAIPEEGCSHSIEAEKFVELLNAIREAGCELILVAPPVSPFFLDEARTAPGYQEGRDFFATLARDRGVPLLDHSATVDDPSLFNDNVHLNQRGAVIFTAALNKQLQQLKSDSNER